MSNYSEIPNNSTDCISRDSAIKALGYDIKCFKFKRGINRHMDDIAKLLNTIYETQVNNVKALPSVTPQEPIEPMVEIDLYSVIKQKYIERKVLDKLRAEIERQEKWLMDAGYNQYNVDIALDAIKSVVDKYKAETEEI